jgi:hypothetical protein
MYLLIRSGGGSTISINLLSPSHSKFCFVFSKQKHIGGTFKKFHFIWWYASE